MIYGMATTTKKKTSAKAKTSKKPSTKSKKTTSKATAKKSATSKKITKTKATTSATKLKASSAKKPLSVFDKMNVWNWAMAGLYAAQAAAVLYLGSGNSKSYPVTTTFLTEDTLASTDGNAVMAQGSRLLFDLNIVYLLAGILLLGAALHLVVATVYRSKYEADLKTGVNKARWIEVGISGGLSLVAIAMLAGVSDISTFKLLGVLTVVASLVALVTEISRRATKSTNWLSYWVSIFAGLTPWLVILSTILASLKYGVSGSIPSYVYWVAGLVFLVAADRALVRYMHYKKMKTMGLDLSDYLVVERIHMVESLASSAILTWIIYAYVINV